MAFGLSLVDFDKPMKGTTVIALVEMAMTSWMPSFLIRAHGFSLSEVGVGMGLIVGIGGVIGTMAGGWQGSYFGRKGMQHMLWVPIAGLLLCIPLYLAVLYAPGPLRCASRRPIWWGWRLGRC